MSEASPTRQEYRGNWTDLVALLAAVFGFAALAPCLMGGMFSCLPLILGAIGLAVYRSHVDTQGLLSGQSAAAAHSTLGAALAIADQLPPGSGATLRDVARHAFTQGLQLTSLISAVIALGGAIIAAVIVRSSRRLGIAPEKA